jgi:hypothetical protein
MNLHILQDMVNSLITPSSYELPIAGLCFMESVN